MGSDAFAVQKPLPAMPVAKNIPIIAAEPSVTPFRGPKNKPPI